MGIVMLLNWDTFRWCWGAPSPASSASPSSVMRYTQKLPWSCHTCFLSPHTHWAKNLVWHLTAASIPPQEARQTMGWSLFAHHSPNLPDKLAQLWLWVELKINFYLPVPKVITLWHFMPCKSRREMQLAPKMDVDSVQWLQKWSVPMLHTPKNRDHQKLPAPSHPTHVTCLGTRKGTNTRYGQPGISFQSVLCKGPYLKPGSLCSLTPASFSGRAQHLLKFAQHHLCSRVPGNCSRWWQMVVEGWAQLPWYIETLVSEWSNRQSQPKHAGSLGHLSPQAWGLSASKRSLNLQLYKCNKLS